MSVQSWAHSAKIQKQLLFTDVRMDRKNVIHIQKYIDRRNKIEKIFKLSDGCKGIILLYICGNLHRKEFRKAISYLYPLD